MESREIRRIDNPSFRDDVFDIRWRVTSLCNYQCDFCIQGNREEHQRQSEGESAQIRGRICDALVRLIEGLEEYRTVNVSLIGGELTILPDFAEILEKLAMCRYAGSIRFTITTNFFRDSGYFFRLCDIISEKAENKARSLHIGTSFYSAYTDVQSFSEKLRAVYEYSTAGRTGKEIFGKLLKQKRNTVSFSAGIPILKDDDYTVFTRMRDAFQDTKIRITPIYIRNYETSVPEDTLKKMLVSSGNGIRVTGENGREYMYENIQALGAALEGTDSFCPRGYFCDAGTHSFWTDAFGHVNRCPAIGSDMHLGSLLDGDFHLLEGPAVCTSGHCSCSQFGRIEKSEDTGASRRRC